MRLVRSIFRYPVKGLTPQPVASVDLESGKPFPFDRMFALARPGAPIDLAEPKWAKKGMFVMLMLDEALAQVRTELNIQTLELAITKADRRVLTADLRTTRGREDVEAFFEDLVPRLEGRPRLVRSTDGHFMDKPDNVVSLINLATVRGLERKWSRPIDPLRFRANFYIDGIDPWEEFNWIGKDIQLGGVLMRADRRNGRCGATNVNPVTGQRDMDIPMALRRDFGHKDLGIYLVVRKAGEVAVGDPVTVPQSGPQARESAGITPAATIAPGSRSFICRGCYFIYDEASGQPAASIAPGTPFADIPPQWRCADCGTGKSAFSPYVAESTA
jgi:GntR family transcriptional regulator/MocR family aminotransferase